MALGVPSAIFLCGAQRLCGRRERIVKTSACQNTIPTVQSDEWEAAAGWVVV